MHKLLFIPVGGLANRMRAMASALTLARKTDSQLQVVWFQDWALHAPFHALFQPVILPHFTLKEASWLDYISYDRPRKKNLYLPRLFQKLRFRSCLYEKVITPLCKQDFNFEAWIKQGSVYMASYTAFQNYSFELLRKLFIPKPELQQVINNRCKSFSNYTIGVHIRRTDNRASIEQSPLELFVTTIDRELAEHESLSIYLATDSESVKQEMRKRYGERLICADEKADRNSTSGIQGGIIDMYTLARTQKIYGSFQSSFSELAAQIGGIPLRIIRKKENIY